MCIGCKMIFLKYRSRVWRLINLHPMSPAPFDLFHVVCKPSRNQVKSHGPRMYLSTGTDCSYTDTSVATWTYNLILLLLSLLIICIAVDCKSLTQNLCLLQVILFPNKLKTVTSCSITQRCSGIHQLYGWARNWTSLFSPSLVSLSQEMLRDIFICYVSEHSAMQAPSKKNITLQSNITNHPVMYHWLLWLKHDIALKMAIVYFLIVALCSWSGCIHVLHLNCTSLQHRLFVLCLYSI